MGFRWQFCVYPAYVKVTYEMYHICMFVSYVTPVKMSIKCAIGSNWSRQHHSTRERLEQRAATSHTGRLLVISEHRTCKGLIMTKSRTFGTDWRRILVVCVGNEGGDFTVNFVVISTRLTSSRWVVLTMVSYFSFGCWAKFNVKPFGLFSKAVFSAITKLSWVQI